jgi:hypothetical protein
MKGYRHCYPTIAYLLSQSAEDFKKSYPEDTEKMREELIKLRDKVSQRFLAITVILRRASV